MSVVTHGGADQIMLYPIVKNTETRIVSLTAYIESVREESSSQTQWPTSIKSGFTLADYTVKVLRRRSQFTRQNPDFLVDFVRGINFSAFPTYLSFFKANPDQHRDWDREDDLDIPAMLLEQARIFQELIVKAWEDVKYGGGDRLSPARFGNLGWHQLQTERGALLCHRPASNRPHRPLEIMHVAFYEFFKNAEPDNIDEFADFHAAAYALCKHLTDSLENVKDRTRFILEDLEKVFPDNMEFKWSATQSYLVYQRILTSEYHPRFPQQPNMDYVTNLIIIKVNLEEGENGDAFMHVARHYGNIVEGNPRYYETGAPTFLITMSGPNIKICGGWADNPECGASIDIFEIHFACLDVAGRHSLKLARSLYSLSRAIKLLPLCHIPSSGCVIKDVPSIFTTFESYDHPGREYGLHLLSPLTSNVFCTAFGAYGYKTGVTLSGSPLELNCVAKLVYHQYGVGVQKALETFAPKLYGWSHKPGIDTCVYIMDYLCPPSWNSEGWLTLTALGLDGAAMNLAPICRVLREIVDRLIKLKFVHGDLCPDHLMIKMKNSMALAEPVQIKVVDFKWAGEVGSACYPADRNEDLGYPGEPAGLIEWDHDLFMIEKWQKSMEAYKYRNTGGTGGIQHLF